MAPAGWDHEEEWKLSRHIIERFEARASGASVTVCSQNYPRDVYFIGNLRPQGADEADAQAAPHLAELTNKLSPVAFGVDFRVRATQACSIRTILRWSCFYRVFPTLPEQRRHQLTGGASADVQQERRADRSSREPQRPESRDTDEEAADSTEEAREDNGGVAAENASARRAPPAQRDTLLLKFKKMICETSGTLRLVQDEAGDWSGDFSDLEQNIDGEIARISAEIRADPSRIRVGDNPYEAIRVPEAALKSEADFDRFLGGLKTVVEPIWDWDVRVEVHNRRAIDENSVVIAVRFANASALQKSPQGRDHPHLEPYIFTPSARFSAVDCDFVAFEIDLAPRGFRYDRSIAARGFNCAVERTGNGDLVTVHVPKFEQMRYLTRETPPARFDDLATDPIPTLEAILAAMVAYGEEWDRAEAEHAARFNDWISTFSAEYAQNRATFDGEVARFRRGLSIIRADSDVRLAFQLTNATFSRTGKHSWRLFQIVFLVSQVPALAALAGRANGIEEEVDTVDIIYFPTGGGKTEAYLATVVLHCFMDRLRGKSAGVTAWTRFPLRLLTLQQVQRAADVVCIADLVRREQTDVRLSGPSVHPFSVGYFVGSTSTPNELVNADTYTYAKDRERALWATALDDAARQNWRRLLVCPSCRTNTVVVDLDRERVRLIHRCTRAECKFPGGRIPICIVDNEIYRFLPTVLVGTIDKLAGIGNQRKMAMLFGDVDGTCAVHGFYKGRCAQKGCDGRQLKRSLPAGLSGPTIFVQDELHLLKEGLGTFDAHYETFVQELASEIKAGARMKVIASSATIEKFERQVEHLYGRRAEQARVFPGPGPYQGRSFYAQTLPYPQRIYTGIIPHNKTLFNAILETLEIYHRIIHSLIALPTTAANPYGGNLRPGTDQWHELLDLYVTSLSYFLAMRELNSLRMDLDNDVSPRLASESLSPLTIYELTGSVGTDEVTRTLDHLQQSKPGRETSTAVLATSMISHGVDIDRLNSMIFYGMPRQNAEYIQASSRVGRAHVGLVLMCFHPARERDQSHYAFFQKYHEYLGQLVEPVAINRWAKFSVNRTLPGLFMAVLLQLIANQRGGDDANKYYMIDFVRKQITTGQISAADFVTLLERAYRISANHPGAAVFRDEIRLRVRQFLDQIVGAAAAGKMVSDALIPKPMTSLRDVDEPITIELDADGTQWASRVGG